METVARAIVVYLFLLVIFRISGKRTLGQVTTFDFVLLLIISETTQQALIGVDFSIVNCMLLIATLATIDIALSLLARRYPRIARLTEGAPLIIVENGKPLRERMRREQVNEDDILHAARATQGLESMDQIKHAVLERNGGISVIPREREQ